jgi:4-amino-4-deoxy-L-arabinose transferase-like glycosyltransferase
MRSALNNLLNRLSVVTMHSAFLPVVFTFGIGLPLIVYLLFPAEFSSDAAWYVARAQEMAAGLGYQEGGFPTAYWPIGWPALLAAGLLLTDSIQVVVITYNLIAVLATMYCLLWLGRRLTTNEQTARLAVAMFAFYPGAIAAATQAWTEPAYTAIMLGAFCLSIAAVERSRWVLLAGLLLGFATLIKPQSLLFPIGMFVALWLVYRNYGFGSTLKHLAIVYTLILLIVLPWSFRNYSVFGEFVLVSTNGGTALLIGAHDRTHGEHIDPRRTGIYDLGISWDERVERQVELNKMMETAAFEWITANPERYVALMPTKIGLLWRKDTYPFWGFDATYPNGHGIIRALQALNQLYYIAVLVLALPCALIALHALLVGRDKHSSLALLFCMPVFVTLLAAVFTGQVRYHYPAMPYLLLAAAWSLFALQQILCQRDELSVTT